MDRRMSVPRLKLGEYTDRLMGPLIKVSILCIIGDKYILVN